MPKEIFESVVDAPAGVGTRKWYTLPLSIVAHMAGLGAIVTAPLIATGVLPSPASLMVFTIAAPAPPPLPPPPAIRRAIPAADAPAAANPNVAPVQAPQGFSEEPPEQTLTRHAGVTDGLPRGLPSAGVSFAPAPPPRPQYVRPGGDIKEPRKILDARPVYPAVAIAAKIEGRVIIEATISRDGGVIDAAVLRSQPMLDQAALDAVRQWRFTPTLLNGIPVEVKMTVTVNFSLH
jgi:protein TonB